MPAARMTELEVLGDVAARLERAGFAYMLSGSLAMSYYATPRMTRDIDLVVEMRQEDAERLRAAFDGDYYVPDDLDAALTARGMFNLVHFNSVVKVDIIVRKDDAFRRHEFERRVRVGFDTFDAWVTSREDLILSKLVWAKEADSEQQRRDVVNLLPGADMAYLRQWAPPLGVEDLLDRLSP